MNKPDPNPTTNMPGPHQYLEDDFTGPPVTAAEVAILQRLAFASAELALIVFERAKVAAQPEAAQPVAVEPADAAPSRTAPVADAFEHQIRSFDHLLRGTRLAFGQKARLVLNLQTWRRRNAEAVTDPAKPAKPAKQTARARGPEMDVNHPLLVAFRVIKKENPLVDCLPYFPRMRQWWEERDGDGQLSSRPLGAHIALLCHAVGVKPNWGFWQDQPWVEDAERAFAEAGEMPAPEEEEDTFAGWPEDDGRPSQESPPETAPAEPAQPATGPHVVPSTVAEAAARRAEYGLQPGAIPWGPPIPGYPQAPRPLLSPAQFKEYRRRLAMDPFYQSWRHTPL